MPEQLPQGNDRPQEIPQTPRMPVAAGAAPSGGHLIVARQAVGVNGEDQSRCLIQVQVFNTDGSACGPEIMIDAVAWDNLNHPAIAALADGRFALAWQEASNSDRPAHLALRVQVFNADGSAWQPTPQNSTGVIGEETA